MNYVICDAIPPRGVCRLGSLQNVPKWPEMQHGESQEGQFPSDACFHMHEDFPKDIKLADAFSNTNNLLVVSDRLSKLLKELKALKGNEVFDVAIFNHKGRREKEKFFVIHQTNFKKCVDEKKTIGKKSSIDSEQYVTMRKLVLDEKKISKQLAIFRPLEYNERAFFRRDVAEAITEAGIVGLQFFEIEEYDEF